jgi:hypothetical protein
MICLHCRERVTYDSYWQTWEHKNRAETLEAELCEPEKGFHGSTYATPTFGE